MEFVTGMSSLRTDRHGQNNQMKQGQYFRIPEGPTDVDLMRREAEQIGQGTSPGWLDQADWEYYRYLGKRSCKGLSPAERRAFFSEIHELEVAGLVADADANNGDVRHLYIRSRSDYDIWSIGIYRGDSPLSLHPANGAENPVLTRDHVADEPAELVADPFMVRRDSSWFMFFEILNWRTQKGEIGLATSNDMVRWEYQQRVLVEPFHLSYPCVFAAQSQYFMIPETHQTDSVRLYRAADFPTKWVFVTTLLDGGYFADASIFFHKERYWLLVASARGRHDTLRLYLSERLTGPWEEHPSSPIVDGNSQSARPGGRVVIDGNRILRFAQNCQPAYGTDVRAFDIIELSPTTYREQEVHNNPILGPSGAGWNASGMHHIDLHKLANDDWIACVDGWTSERS